MLPYEYYITASYGDIMGLFSVLVKYLTMCRNTCHPGTSRGQQVHALPLADPATPPGPHAAVSSLSPPPRCSQRSVQTACPLCRSMWRRLQTASVVGPLCLLLFSPPVVVPLKYPVTKVTEAEGGGATQQGLLGSAKKAQKPNAH